MVASDAELAAWQLRWLTKEIGGELSDSELRILISFEEQFKRRGWLTEPQMDTLQNIYERHS